MEIEDEAVNGIAFMVCEYALLNRNVYAVPFNLVLVGYIICDTDFKGSHSWVKSLNLVEAKAWVTPFWIGDHWMLVAENEKTENVLGFHAL